jgi:hypothetical protein
MVVNAVFSEVLEIGFGGMFFMLATNVLPLVQDHCDTSRLWDYLQKYDAVYSGTSLPMCLRNVLQGIFLLVARSACSSTMRTEAARSSEMSENSYQTAVLTSQKTVTLHCNMHENLKSNVVWTQFSNWR